MKIRLDAFRTLRWSVAAATVFTVAFRLLVVNASWRDVWRFFLVGLVFSVCISALCTVVLSRLGPYLSRRCSAPLYWLIMVAAMTGLAFAGSLIAAAILIGFGYLRPNQFVTLMRNSLGVSLLITLTVGIAITMLETMRGRLERTTLALRTKERDEAEARRLMAEAQLASLESRVQPHFLFNTLNSIASLIPTDPTGAEQMTTRLASLLRSSLDASTTPLGTLRDELKTARDYLEIERVRIGARLHYEIVAAPGTDEVLLPRLTLQTIVENSVKYAVAPRREGGHIVVRSIRNADTITIAVRDDGPGFDGEDVPEGHGLALVRDRLRLTLGDRAELVIQSRPRDTVVSIVVRTT